MQSADVNPNLWMRHHFQGVRCWHNAGILQTEAPPDGIIDRDFYRRLRSHVRWKQTKIGAGVVGHGRNVTVSMVEIALPRQMSREIPTLLARIRLLPAPA